MSKDLARLLHTLWPASQVGERSSHWSPAVDIYRIGDSGWLLKFDLAGVRPTDIHVSVAGRQLVVSGRRRDWLVEETGPCSAYSMEISYCHFERALELPSDIAQMQILTEYRDGMLLVRLQEQGSTG